MVRGFSLEVEYRGQSSPTNGAHVDAQRADSVRHSAGVAARATTPQSSLVALSTIRMRPPDRISDRRQLIHRVKELILAHASAIAMDDLVRLTSNLTDDVLRLLHSGTELRFSDLPEIVVPRLMQLGFVDVPDRQVGHRENESPPTVATVPPKACVVVAKPIVANPGGDVTVYATVRGGTNACSVWALAKGSSFSSRPLSMDSMYRFGVAVSRVVVVKDAECCVQLAISAGVLEAGSQYVVRLNCRTDSGDVASDVCSFMA